MFIFTRIFLLIGIFLILGVTHYVAISGFGLSSVRNAEVIRKLNKDCPPNMRDAYGNCKNRTFRSSYYETYIIGSGTRGGGGK